MDKEKERLDWLRRKRSLHCPRCREFNPGFNLIKATFWCPDCEKVWRYRYFNQEQVIKKANRQWWYEGDKKSTRIK